MTLPAVGDLAAFRTPVRFLLVSADVHFSPLELLSSLEPPYKQDNAKYGLHRPAMVGPGGKVL